MNAWLRVGGAWTTRLATVILSPALGLTIATPTFAAALHTGTSGPKSRMVTVHSTTSRSLAAIPARPASDGPLPTNLGVEGRNPTIFTPVMLTDLSSVAITNNCGLNWDVGGTRRSGGRDYPDSMSVGCGVGQRATIDYLVPTGARTLHGSIGITDDSENTGATVKFTITDVSLHPLTRSQTLSFGRASKISAPLTGVVRFRLQIEVVTSPPNAAGGVNPAFLSMQIS